MPLRAPRRHFRRHGLGEAAGILITTARKMSGASDDSMERRRSGAASPSDAILLAEHGTLTRDIIALRQVHYRDAATTVLNSIISAAWRSRRSAPT